jgi:hypothetical protein
MGVFLDQFETTGSTALQIKESKMLAKLRGRFPPPGTQPYYYKSHAPERVNRDCNPLLISL